MQPSFPVEGTWSIGDNCPQLQVGGVESPSLGSWEKVESMCWMLRDTKMQKENGTHIHKNREVYGKFLLPLTASPRTRAPTEGTCAGSPTQL